MPLLGARLLLEDCVKTVKQLGAGVGQIHEVDGHGVFGDEGGIQHALGQLHTAGNGVV